MSKSEHKNISDNRRKDLKHHKQSGGGRCAYKSKFVLVNPPSLPPRVTRELRRGEDPRSKMQLVSHAVCVCVVFRRLRKDRGVRSEETGAVVKRW